MSGQLLVAFITFVISFFGALANILVFFAAVRIDSMNSSFGIITKNQAFCNILMCSILLFFICPLQFSSSNALISISHFFGTLAMIIYEASNQSHLLMAINRFCAIFYQSNYSIIFSKKGTHLMMTAIWLISMLMCIVLYEILTCYFSYNDSTWTLDFYSSKVCADLTWYSDFIFNTSLIVLTILINLITAYKAHSKSKSMLNSAGMEMSKEQKKRELNFIRQTFSQGITVFSGQLTYHLITPLLDNPILLFLVATLWAFMHAVEGFVILGSNLEIRNFVFKKMRKRSSTVFAWSISV